jgi:hypothetical protein
MLAVTISDTDQVRRLTSSPATRPLASSNYTQTVIDQQTPSSSVNPSSAS